MSEKFESLSEITRGIAREIREKLEREELPFAPPAPIQTLCIRDCPICGGQGYVSPYDKPIGHPDFGKIFPCPNRPMNTAQVGLEYAAEFTWKDLIEGDPNVAPAVDAVMAALERGYGWVYLHGASGRAKTLILQQAVREAAERGLTAQYSLTEEVLGWLRAAYDEERKQFSFDQQLERLASVQVLALDEVDRFNNTVWAQTQVFRLMNDRYQSALRQRTVTLMAANVSPSVYRGEFAYLQDRILDGRFKVIHVEGASLRPSATWSSP